MFHDMFVRVSTLFATGCEQKTPARCGRRASRQFVPQLGCDALESRLALSGTTLLNTMASGSMLMPGSQTSSYMMSTPTTITLDNSDAPQDSSGSPVSNDTTVADQESSPVSTEVAGSDLGTVGDFPTSGTLSLEAIV